MSFLGWAFGQVCKWALIAFLALMAWSAWGDPVLVQVWVPGSFEDGSGLDPSERVGARVYCRKLGETLPSEVYTRETQVSPVEIILPVTTLRRCYATILARHPDSVGVQESVKSHEVILGRLPPAKPEFTVSWQTQTASCQTECRVGP